MTILTVTANPAVDKSVRCDQVTPERKLRCEAPRRDPGGGGLNVARGLTYLGDEAVAIAALGGLAGDVLAELLDDESVPLVRIGVEGETRENLVVTEGSTGNLYRFGMPGPSMTAGEAEELVAAVRDEAPAEGWVVASGSLPSGAPADLYARMGAAAREAGARFALDSSKEALVSGVESGYVDLLKPNFRELGEVAGRELEGEEDAAEVAEDLVSRELARIVLLSLGAGGALLVTTEGRTRLPAPAVPVASKIGAGDSAMAGMIHGLARGWDVVRAARMAVACGAAAVTTPGTELFRAQDARELLACMEGRDCKEAEAGDIGSADRFE